MFRNSFRNTNCQNKESQPLGSQTMQVDLYIERHLRKFQRTKGTYKNSIQLKDNLILVQNCLKYIFLVDIFLLL